LKKINFKKCVAFMGNFSSIFEGDDGSGHGGTEPMAKKKFKKLLKLSTAEVDALERKARKNGEKVNFEEVGYRLSFGKPVLSDNE